MKTFAKIIEIARQEVNELFPWDVEERRAANKETLILDIREECEYRAYHIHNSMLVPRGILETACEYDYEDSVPELVESRDREIIIICRSGNRSILACQTMQIMGYNNVKSMKTGLRGWNDYELPLINIEDEVVTPDDVERLLKAGFCSEQMHPERYKRTV